MRVTSLQNLITKAGEISPVRSMRTVSCPIFTQNTEGKFKIAEELVGDTCHFTRADRSLNPEFIRGLMKIEGKNSMETCGLIKDEILRAMGYTHPEALQLKHTKSEHMCAFMPIQGHVLINETAYKLIHMFQFVA